MKNPSARRPLHTRASVNHVKKKKVARPSNQRASTSAENRGNAHEEDEVRTELRIHTSRIVPHDSSNPRHSVAVHTAEPSQYMSCPNALVGAGSAS